MVSENALLLVLVNQMKQGLFKTVPKGASYVLGWMVCKKRNTKYALSSENELVWTSENQTTTLVWSRIICFVFVEKKKNRYF